MGSLGAQAQALKIIRKYRGILRTRDALRLGVHPRTLYQLRDEGTLEELSRGIYRLASLPQPGNPDLITVAMRVPRAIVSLISALSFHEITTQIPNEVQITLPRGTKSPKITYPPIRVFRWSGAPLTTGIERVEVDAIPIRVYCPEKTVADCFRFRNRIGLDVAIEALNFCIERKRSKPADLLRYARICRVERVMLPYLQARQ